jgi:hypothetical protein
MRYTGARRVGEVMSATTLNQHEAPSPEVIERIVEAIDPEKVIVFGSRAWDPSPGQRSRSPGDRGVGGATVSACRAAVSGAGAPAP